MGRPEQSTYLNGVWEIETDIEPRPLKFEVLEDIERKTGRVWTEDKYAPRTLDLDILIYKGRVIDEPDLQVPDPELAERPFLYLPLGELAPDLVLPGSGESMSKRVNGGAGLGMRPADEMTRRIRERGKR